MKEIKNCPICNGTTFTPFLRCQDETVSHETFSLVKCKQCNFILTNPQPEPDELGKYYLSDKYISHTGQAKSLIDKLYLIVRDFTLKRKLNLINRHSTGERKNLLDFGCGTGEFLNICKSNGWNINGVEKSEEARTKAEILTGTNLSASLQGLPPMEYEIITLWHVLEHIDNPNEILHSLSCKLSKNGTLIIAVPNHESHDARLYKEKWAAYDVPRHLWHFNKNNMQELLKKEGLTINSIEPMKLDAFYVSMLSENYIDPKKKINGMIKALYNGFISNMKAKRKNQYSSLIYIASK